MVQTVDIDRAGKSCSCQSVAVQTIQSTVHRLASCMPHGVFLASIETWIMNEQRNDLCRVASGPGLARSYPTGPQDSLCASRALQLRPSMPLSWRTSILLLQPRAGEPPPMQQCLVSLSPAQVLLSCLRWDLHEHHCFEARDCCLRPDVCCSINIHSIWFSTGV